MVHQNGAPCEVIDGTCKEEIVPVRGRSMPGSVQLLFRVQSEMSGKTRLKRLEVQRWLYSIPFHSVLLIPLCKYTIQGN